MLLFRCKVFRRLHSRASEDALCFLFWFGFLIYCDQNVWDGRGKKKKKTEKKEEEKKGKRDLPIKNWFKKKKDPDLEIPLNIWVTPVFQVSSSVFLFCLFLPELDLCNLQYYSYLIFFFQVSMLYSFHTTCLSVFVFHLPSLFHSSFLIYDKDLAEVLRDTELEFPKYREAIFVNHRKSLQKYDWSIDRRSW